MSGGSDSVTNIQSVPAWVQPYAENYMQRSQQVADMPYEAYTGQTVAQFNPFQTDAYNAQAQRAIQGSPLNAAASEEVQKTLSGGYLNSNPYLDKSIDLASQDVLRNMTGMDARSGSFGNSGIQANTAEALGNIATTMRGNDYAAERNRMQGAVNQAPMIAGQDYVDAQALADAGKAFQGQEQLNLSDQYNRWAEARNYPKDQLATLGRGVGMNFGSSNTSTGPGANPYAQAIGTGLAAYGAYNSGGGK